MSKLFCFVALFLISTPLFAQNWVSKTTGTTGQVYGIDFVSASVVWISTKDGGTAVSTDGGNTWVKGATSAGQGAFSIAALSDKVACVSLGPDAGDGKIMRTADGGATWTQVYTKAGSWFNFIDNIDATNLWALSDPVAGKFLIVKSTDAGLTWAEIANPPAAPASNVYGANDSYYRIGKTAWFGTGGGSGATAANKVFKSTTVPEGPWTSGNTTQQFVGSMAFSSDAGAGLAGFWSSGIVNKTIDGGANWTAFTGTRADSVYAFEYVQGTAYCWMATSAGIFRSTNNGTTWTQDTQQGGGRTFYAIRFFGDVNYGLAGGDNGVVLKSMNSPVLPVELTSFTALQAGTFANLTWTTATETNNRGFEIERKLDDGQFMTIAFKNGFGTSSQSHSYTYSDNLGTVTANTITYRLKQFDFDGSFSYSDQVAVNYVAPVNFNLSQNYPNPFNPATVLSYQIPNDNFVSLKVYNTLGQLVSTLVNEVKTAGSYKVTFDAAKLNSGVYYAVIKVGNSLEMTKTIKMSLIK